MKINMRLTKCCLEIGKIFEKLEVNHGERLEVLLQLATKIYISADENPKELFIKYIEELYDALEEYANTNGII